MKQVKARLVSLLMLSSLSITINCLAADSTHVKQGTIIAMKSGVVLTKDDECITTKEEPYSVTMTYHRGVYPACPPNMVFKSMNFRTETSSLGFEVTTYVSAVCCKHQIEWQPITESRQQPPA